MVPRLKAFSERKAFTAGRNLEFTDIAPLEGPTGGRWVVDYYMVMVEAQVDITVAQQDGEDLWKFLTRIQYIESNGFVRCNLEGRELRVSCYRDLGSKKVTEQLDLAVANNQTLLLQFPVYLEKPKVKRKRDFAAGADELRKFLIECGTTASIATVTGGTTVAIDSATVYIIAYGHEEHDVQFHAKDSLESFELQSTTQAKIPVDGKIHGLTLWAPGDDNGGASLANFTSARIDTKQMLETTTRDELKREYQFFNDEGASGPTVGQPRSNDPHTLAGSAVRAVTLLNADDDTSCFSGPYLKNIKLDLSNTVASVRAIMRIVRPPDPAHRDKIAAAWGIPDMNGLTVKTAAKTKTSIGDWAEEDQGWLPLKAKRAA